MHRLSLLLLALAAALLCSCKTAKSVVASVSVKPSSFLTHGNELKEDRSKSPFLGNWWTADKKLQAAAGQHYIETVWGRGYVLRDPLEGKAA